MPTPGQRLGYAGERRCMAALRAEHYVVWKSGGSLSAADLLAAKPGQWLLVQVKAGRRKGLEHQWFNELFATCTELSAGGHAGAWMTVVPVVADWPDRTAGRWGPMRLRRITGLHLTRSQFWPMEPFSIDTAEE